MTKRHLNWAVFLLFLSCTLMSARTVAISQYARVSYVSGKANVKPAQLVSPGNWVRTGSNGRVVLAFSNGHRLRIGPASHIKLVSYRPQNKQTLVQVDKGKVWNRVKPGHRVVVRTRHSTATVLGTAYQIAAEEKQTRTQVFDGSVGVTQAESKPENELFLGLPTLKDLPQTQSSTGAFSAPTEVKLDIHEVPLAVKAVPGPYAVSQNQWLEIVKNQEITMQANGEASIRQIDPTALVQSDEWLRWNQSMDQAFMSQSQE